MISSENVFSFVQGLVKFDWRICLQALCTKIFVCPIAFGHNSSSSIFWVATFPVDKHTKSCCSALNGFIQLLASMAIGDFTLKTEAFGAPCCLGVLIDRLLVCLIKWNPIKGVLVTDLDRESTRLQKLMGLRKVLFEVGHLRQVCR